MSQYSTTIRRCSIIFHFPIIIQSATRHAFSMSRVTINKMHHHHHRMNMNMNMKSVRRLWIAHFLIGIGVLLIGLLSNGGTRQGRINVGTLNVITIVHWQFDIFIMLCSCRKYIPLRNLDLSKLHDQRPQSICSKAYVNVYSTSHDESDAWVCCDGPSDSLITHSSRMWPLSTWTQYIQSHFSYRALLCHPWVRLYLFFILFYTRALI